MQVLGAAMFYVRVGQQSFLYTGDYNMTPDRHLGTATSYIYMYRKKLIYKYIYIYMCIYKHMHIYQIPTPFLGLTLLRFTVMKGTASGDYTV